MDIRKRKRGASPFHYFKQPTAIIVTLFVVLTLFSLRHLLSPTHYFPIRTVQVYGVNHLDQSEVQEAVSPLIKPGFFHINIDLVRERLLQMPWVRQTFVKKAWPDKLEITVIEKNAIARWNQETLLTEKGEFFSPRLESYPEDLPDLSGPDGKQDLVIEYFNEINRLLIPIHAKISSLELSAYYTWKLTLTNGLAFKLGHKDVLTRLKHFVKVYPKIIGERSSDDVEYIDLRYSNGMAVRWKAPTKL